MKDEKQELLESRVSIAIYIEGVLSPEQDKEFSNNVLNWHLANDGVPLEEFLKNIKPTGFKTIPTNITANISTSHKDESETHVTRYVKKMMVIEMKAF